MATTNTYKVLPGLKVKLFGQSASIDGDTLVFDSVINNEAAFAHLLAQTGQLSLYQNTEGALRFKYSAAGGLLPFEHQTGIELEDLSRNEAAMFGETARWDSMNDKREEQKAASAALAKEEEAGKSASDPEEIAAPFTTPSTLAGSEEVKGSEAAATDSAGFADAGLKEGDAGFGLSEKTFEHPRVITTPPAEINPSGTMTAPVEKSEAESVEEKTNQ